jgi:hypothetical protein
MPSPVTTSDQPALLAVAAEALGVPIPAARNGRHRRGSVQDARVRIVASALGFELGMPLVVIAPAVGVRCHSTVHWYLRAHRAALDTEREYQVAYGKAQVALAATWVPRSMPGTHVYNRAALLTDTDRRIHAVRPHEMGGNTLCGLSTVQMVWCDGIALGSASAVGRVATPGELHASSSEAHRFITCGRCLSSIFGKGTWQSA